MTTPTPIPAETTEPNQPTSPTDKDPQAKSKSKRKISGPSPNAAHEELNVTIRNHVGSWTYFSVELISSPHSPDPLDPLTATTHLRSALSQFLGLTGAAIPIDILKCGSDQPSSTPLSASIPPAPSNDGLPSIASQAENQRKSEVWIRVPREDGDAVAAALGSSWVGRDGGRDVSWRVRGRGEWLGALVGEERGKSLWD